MSPGFELIGNTASVPSRTPQMSPDSKVVISPNSNLNPFEYLFLSLADVFDHPTVKIYFVFEPRWQGPPMVRPLFVFENLVFWAG